MRTAWSKLIGSMLGFAATLKRTAASQTLLDTNAVKVALADLDRAVGELRGALNLCGILPT